MRFADDIVLLANDQTELEKWLVVWLMHCTGSRIWNLIKRKKVLLCSKVGHEQALDIYLDAEKSWVYGIVIFYVK